MHDDKLIEAMAIAIHEQTWGPWEEADDGERTDARDYARAALAALEAELASLRTDRDAAQAEARNWKRIAEDATHVEREELSRLREAGSRAAEIIRREAESIRDAHKARGVDWTGSHGAEARAMYDEMMAVVAALSQPATEQPTDCGNCHEGTTEFGHRCPQCEGAGKQPAEICPNCDGQLPEGCRGTFSSEPECRGHYQQLAERESLPLTFTQGVLCSLSILDRYGDSIAYREVADPHDLNQLWEEADEFDREHLARHGYRPTPAAQESCDA